MTRTVFASKISFQDAAFKAKMKGYKVVGQANRPDGSYVVFGERVV